MNLLQKHKASRNFTIIPVLSITLALLLIVSFSIDRVLAQPNPFIATTRGSFDKTNGNLIQQANLHSALSILNSTSCPGQLAIYVHGVWASEQQAKEQTDRVFLSLQNSGLNIPVVGFSWDSDTAPSGHGWDIAKKIANENGPVLANFIGDFKGMCPNDDLRIIAHSLGSRVALSAIQSLYDSNPHEAVSKIITSVHLLGAAVDNEQVSTDNLSECIHTNSPPLKCSGQAIGLVVGHFFNLYNPEDNMLADQVITTCWFGCWDSTSTSPYHISENDNPLGASPIRNIINVPSNFDEYSVENAIGLDKDANKDGKCDLMLGGLCTIIYRGDNHFGYMGYRSSDNPQVVHDSGAIGSVAIDWVNESD